MRTKLSLEEKKKKWKKYDTKYNRRRRRAQKIKLFKYKGGKCERCGYDKKIMSAYAFHHKDPSKKEYHISSSFRNYETAVKEVDKCQLLCVRCHAEVHDYLLKKQKRLKKSKICV